MQFRLERFVAALLLPYTCDSWSYVVTTGEDWCGSLQDFASSNGETGCYNLQMGIRANVSSYVWCAAPAVGCSITTYNAIDCEGALLNKENAAFPEKWESSQTSDREKQVQSFEVTGCVLQKGAEPDVLSCYPEGQEPWADARQRCAPKDEAEQKQQEPQPGDPNFLPNQDLIPAEG